MTIGVWVLGDQLYEEQAALSSCVSEKSDVRVVLIESLTHVRKLPFHRQKLVLIWSGMRHFAQLLRKQGWLCDYYAQADDFSPILESWVREHEISEVRIMIPNDRPFHNLIQQIDIPCKKTLVPSNHFIWTKEEFENWAQDKKRLVLEYFYREGRRRFDVLMEDGKPIGGSWNFDKENRRPPDDGFKPPTPIWWSPDKVIEEVIDVVRNLDIPLFGELEPFRWAVTREQALVGLENFIDERLPTFGPYEDAMLSGEMAMWHSLMSPYVNIGLLRPMEMIKEAEKAYHERDLELPSVEGFIRQVLGWREFMNGVYNHQNEEYQNLNYFNHSESLPSFFWTGKTEMFCVSEVINQVLRTGYAHHIQRLMILSNFALISGLSPQETERWFHAAFIDSYDWVMQTNVLGMGLFADGGILATKPYAASANYIRRMSDYCKKCVFNPKSRTDEDSCPFNFLYWEFLARNEQKLKRLGRMNLVMSHLDKLPPEELKSIRDKARIWMKDVVESVTWEE